MLPLFRSFCRTPQSGFNNLMTDPRGSDGEKDGTVNQRLHLDTIDSRVRDAALPLGVYSPWGPVQ